ncbi:hypothetical protein Poli38472_007067 [Pythium oligandrum]|uniref:Uncharacterized protein n=1 Tax=Pythium oligandrum TaxID=41045 RepID=A0A8K1FGP5_PYTOL|nr:hypothetical protein Poli38472_007067 [Pythium oligandrum]|eukprot:TMW58922.1 hypothetical protein Poli38472_007067 [Pythium oligandrum]
MIVPASTQDESVAALRGPTAPIISSGSSRRQRWVQLQLRALQTRVWTYIHADWQSHYSLDKLLCLYDYSATTSTLTKLLTLALTPVPTLFIVMIIEAIPLQDFRLGWAHNPGFFARTFIRWFSAGIATGVQWGCHVPELAPPTLPMVIVTGFQAAWVVGGIIGLTEAVGVFPVPYSAFAVLPVFTSVGWGARVYWMRRTLWNRAEPEQSRVERAKLSKLLDVLGFCNQFISVYTISAMVFSQIPAGYQLLLAAVLQLLKIWVKQTEWVKAQLHWPQNDLAALHVATNGQLFHQLFTAMCFQTSKSTLTLALIVMLGIIQDVMAIRAIQRRIHQVNKLQHKVSLSNPASKVSLKTLRSIRAVWPAPDESMPASDQVPTESSWEHYRIRAAELIHSNDPKPPALSQDEIQCVERLTQLYHCRELVLLRMYMDIFVSCLYFVVVAGIRRSVSARYRGFFGTADLGSLFWRIGSQVTTRCVTLSVLLWYLRDQNHPDGLDHLAFILRRQWQPLHGSCMLMALSVIGFSVAHYGNDTTFRFTWLKSKPPAD